MNCHKTSLLVLFYHLILDETNEFPGSKAGKLSKKKKTLPQ